MPQLGLPLVLALATTTGAAQAQTAREVIDGYADLALATYSDTLLAATRLDAAVRALVEAPSAETHDAVKAAWIEARVPYQQSEAFRFTNPIVDDWEGKVNAWPLDEGLIDYVDTGLYGEDNEENQFYRANIVATPSLSVGGETLDAAEITPALLEALHEFDGVEANVATGYHAIEFLLWGQDLNGTEAGAGARAWTDFAAGDACTNGHCDRRGAYLTAASDLLVSDLKYMVAAWEPDGAARADLAALTDADGVAAILTGLGSLSYGELAGDRMQLGLILHDPEEEHDCFSDNTHNSLYFDALGIRNVYTGQYTALDGSVVKVAALADLAGAAAPEEGAEVLAKIDATVDAMAVLKDRADSGVEAYDQMIGYGNDEGNALVQAAIDGLVAQTRAFEGLVAALGGTEFSIEGSDSLDNPSAVFE